MGKPTLAEVLTTKPHLHPNRSAWLFVSSLCVPWRRLKKERDPIQTWRLRDRQKEEGGADQGDVVRPMDVLMVGTGSVTGQM